jgi:hypothetical protein
LASETLRYDVVSTADTRGLKDTARDASLASRAARELSERLSAQSKTAQASSGATLAMAKADKILADAEEVLSGRAEAAARQLRQQGRAAEEAAAKAKLAAGEAKGAGGGFSVLGGGLGLAVAGGVALAPVLATLGLGLGGLGIAALGASKDTRAMHDILAPLKGEVASFQAELKPEVLGLFGQGAGIATSALKQLEPVAAATAAGLHGVLSQVGAELQSGQWKNFFQFMAAQAGPDLQLVGKLVVDLMNDLPGLLIQLQPAARVVLLLADAALKAVGGLERMHLVLPLLGAAIGFMVGGPLGALVGGLAGVALQAASASAQLSRTGQEIQRLDKLKPVTRDMVGFASVAGEVALSLGRQPGALQAVQNAIAAARPVVGTLAGDMATLNAQVVSGNSVLAAYSDLWDKFVGKSVSYQQAVLNLKQAFEGYDAAVKSSGRTSTAAQQSFLSIFTTMGSGLDTLQKQHASVAQLNSFYATTIARLSALHGLTPAQRSDIAGLTRDYLAWASSADRLNRNVVNAAHGLGQDMLTQVSRAHQLVPLARSDTDALANSILKTGTSSRATKHDRDVLVADLVRSGLSAQDARARVKAFQDRIDALHGKTVPVSVTASGSGGINVAATGLAARIFKLSHLAAGARIPGFGGGDVHPALLEGGETVVDKHTSRRLAPVFRAAGVPGYAAGGVAGMVPFTAGQEGSVVGGWAGASVSSMMSAMIAQFRAAAAKAAAASAGVTSTALGGDAAANKALARSMFPWPASMWPSFDYLEMREAGYNRFARNPSSGAYGIPQALPPTKMPFAAQAAGGSHAGPQLSWMYGYISQVYRNPVNAAAHEQAFNWYDRGGILKPGLTLADNGTGRPEQVLPPGRAGGGAGVTIGRLVIENHGIIGSQAEADRFIGNAVDRLANDGRLTWALRHSPSAA